MKAPPRSMWPPASLTSRAAASICSGVSTEHGPAMSAKCPPPILAPLTSMTVSLLLELAADELVRLRMATTRSTPGMASSGSW